MPPFMPGSSMAPGWRSKSFMAIVLARAVPAATSSIEEALEVPGAANLVEEDRAQQSGAGDDLVAGSGHRLAPPAVVDAPPVADAELAVIGAVHAQAGRHAGRIGFDLDERMIGVDPRHWPMSTRRD